MTWRHIPASASNTLLVSCQWITKPCVDIFKALKMPLEVIALIDASFSTEHDSGKETLKETERVIEGGHDVTCQLSRLDS